MGKGPGSVSAPQVRLQIAVWGVPTYNHRLQTDIISLCAKNATLVLLYTFYNANQFISLSWWLGGKESTCNTGDVRDMGSIFGLTDPLEKEMAIHSSILAWEIPWTVVRSGLPSMGLQELDTT